MVMESRTTSIANLDPNARRQGSIEQRIDDDCNPRTADLLNQCFDDEFDVQASNHNVGDATRVADGNTREVQYPGLVLCPHTDWYHIPMEESDGLEFDIFFDPNEGNLDLALFQMTGDRTLVPIDASQGNTGHESERSPPWRRSRDYYLRVYRFAMSDQPTPYGMTVTVMERCADDPAGPYVEQRYCDECQHCPQTGWRDKSVPSMMTGIE